MRRNGARREAPDPGDVVMERPGVDAQHVQLLVQDVGRDAIEEHVHRQDHDHQVVQPADDREVIGDEVPTEHEVSEGSGQHRLAPGGRPLVADQLPEQATVRRRPAGEGQERRQAEQPPEADPLRAAASGRCLPVRAAVPRCSSHPAPHVRPRSAAGTGEGDGSTGASATGPPRATGAC